MRKKHTRIVGAVAALLAAGLAGFSLRSQPRPSTALAARSPAPIVTTQVIRRTIHIVRHQHVGRAAGPGRSLRAGGQVGIQRSRSIRTGASGVHGAGSAATGAAAAGAVVTTRTSPSHSAPGSAPGSSAPASGPVTTRTSPSHAGSGSTGAASAPASARPTTRTSPHGGSGGGATPGSRRVATRSSGSHGSGDGGEHGD